MSVIYEPRGRAKEYSPLALNIYKGCSHGCKYCYAPSATFTDKESFHKSQSVRKDILKKLEKDLQQRTLFREIDICLLCFTSDPYQGDEDFNIVTRKAIELFRQYNYPFQVLTKAGTKAIRDFDLYSKQDRFASTLTFATDALTEKIEPNTAMPSDRIKALRHAKSLGIGTWVSFEPTIIPAHTFWLLDQTHEFVDEYRVGKVSGYKVDVDWDKFAHDIVEKLEFYGKKYYIKDDLKAHL